MVITGAGSGMGRALVLRLSRCGVTLALTDLDTRSVEDTAHHCVSRGAAILVHRLYVADEAAVRAYADAMVERHGAPSMVFNNAGTTMVAGVLDEDTDYARRIMDVNWSGVMHGTNAFRDRLENGGGGRIVNTSSAFGLFGSPMQASYCASKFAVRGFSEGVQAELRVATRRSAYTSCTPGRCTPRSPATPDTPSATSATKSSTDSTIDSQEPDRPRPPPPSSPGCSPDVTASWSDWTRAQ